MRWLAVAVVLAGCGASAAERQCTECGLPPEFEQRCLDDLKADTCGYMEAIAKCFDVDGADFCGPTNAQPDAVREQVTACYDAVPPCG